MRRIVVLISIVFIFITSPIYPDNRDQNCFRNNSISSVNNHCQLCFSELSDNKVPISNYITDNSSYKKTFIATTNIKSCEPEQRSLSLSACSSLIIKNKHKPLYILNCSFLI